MLHYFHRVNKGIQRSNIIAVTGKGCSQCILQCQCNAICNVCKTRINCHLKPTPLLSDLENMIGIKDDVLHMFLLFHVLLLASFTLLVILFVTLLCTRIPGARRDLSGWFGGPARSLDQTSSYFTSSQPARRRGFFSRN